MFRAAQSIRAIALAALLAAISMLVYEMMTDTFVFKLGPWFYIFTISTSAAAYAALGPLTRHLSRGATRSGQKPLRPASSAD